MNDVYKEIMQLATPILGIFALYFFQKINDSVSKLNENVAVVISKIERQEDVITKNTGDIEHIKMTMATNHCIQRAGAGCD